MKCFHGDCICPKCERFRQAKRWRRNKCGDIKRRGYCAGYVSECSIFRESGKPEVVKSG